MRIKKVILLFLIICFAAVNAGCYGTYEAERQYWLANRQYERLLQSLNQASDESQRSEIIKDKAPEVIISLRKITINYPFLPLSSQAMLLIANVYIIEARLDRAIKEYENIINEFPHMREQCASAMIALASIYKERGNWRSAEEIYENVISEYFDTQIGFQAPLLIARYYKSRAMNIEADKTYETAMNLYKEYINDNPDVPQASIALEQLVNCYSDQGEWLEAIRYLQNDIIEDSDSPLALQAMLITGTIYEVQFNSRDKAFEIYRQAVEKFPEDPMVGKIRDRLELYGE